MAIKVRAVWEFEVDTDGFDSKHVDIKGLAKHLAARELADLLAYEKLSAEDFTYEAGFSDRLVVNDVRLLKSPFGNPLVKFLAEVRCLAVEVEAYVFDKPSVYGINGGRVSKLWIREVDCKKPFCDYDRGWDIKPSDCKLPEREKAYEEILAYLEALPEMGV